VQLEGLGQLKKITSSELEPMTFRLVAQCLNHHATTCPQQQQEINDSGKIQINKKTIFKRAL
jgi:hypothetical protein